jgi:hypothetical protein
MEEQKGNKMEYGKEEGNEWETLDFIFDEFGLKGLRYDFCLQHFFFDMVKYLTKYKACFHLIVHYGICSMTGFTAVIYIYMCVCVCVCLFVCLFVCVCSMRHADCKECLRKMCEPLHTCSIGARLAVLLQG